MLSEQERLIAVLNLALEFAAKDCLNPEGTYGEALKRLKLIEEWTELGTREYDARTHRAGAAQSGTVEQMIRAFDEAKEPDYNASPHERRVCMAAALAVANKHRDAELVTLKQRLEEMGKPVRHLLESHCLNRGHRTDQSCPICWDYVAARAKVQP